MSGNQVSIDALGKRARRPRTNGVGIAFPSLGQRRWRSLALVSLQAARSLATAADESTACETTLKVLERAFGDAVGVIGRVSQCGNTLNLDVRGGRAERLQSLRSVWALDQASFGRDILHGQLAVRPRLHRGSTALDLALVEHGVAALVASPITVGRRPWGVILATWSVPFNPGPFESWFLEMLALQLSSAIDTLTLTAELTEAHLSLQDAQDRLLRTERLRTLGQMACGVAHDFNNSLTTILGTVEWVLNDLSPEAPIRPEIETIRTAAVDAATFVRQLQLVGRLTPVPVGNELIDLAAVVQAVPSLARPRAVELGRLMGVSYRMEIDAHPVPAIRATVSEIHELLLNLIFNAFDAMPDGGRVTIRTGATEGWVTLSVSDQGVGMSEEIKARVLEPFFSTKTVDGLGLGLAVCSNITARHGGTLSVESAPGFGATFTASFPTAAEVARSTPALVTQARQVSPHELRILLVDDVEEVRDSVGEMLRALGHHVVAAPDGETALSLAAGDHFDVVITDLAMPGLDGLEVAGRIRTMSPDVPVMLLTGWQVDADDRGQSDVALVLPKPVTLRALRDGLERAMVA